MAAVDSAMLGTALRLVPIAEAMERDDAVQLPYTEATIESAPPVDGDGELTPEQEMRLYEHYGKEWGEAGGIVDDASAASGADSSVARRLLKQFT